MGVRNGKREELGRLKCKTLDAQFRTVIQEGLNCSPFEAEAVVDVVQEVYGPFLNGSEGAGPPGAKRIICGKRYAEGKSPDRGPGDLSQPGGRGSLLGAVRPRAALPTTGHERGPDRLYAELQSGTGGGISGDRL